MGGYRHLSVLERTGRFARYRKDEKIEIAGCSTCGGCPGGNVEYVPEEMKKNGAEVIHLVIGLVVGYPPCPRINQFREYIENRFWIRVVVGIDSIPLKYRDTHGKLSFWENMNMKNIAGELMREDRQIMESYN